MKRLAGIVMVLAGCAVVEEPVENVEQEVYHQPDKCPDSGCGVNSPQVGGSFFHELNLDGIANEGRWVLSGTGKKGSAIYDVSVEAGFIVARFRLGAAGSPSVLRGTALVGLTFGLSRDGVQWDLSITNVQRVADYWARPIGAPAPARIETYRFFVVPSEDPTPGDGIPAFGAYLCQATDDMASDAIPDYHAVVFEGDRVSAAAKTVSSASTRWFNIGCAGSALAKLQLTGHTRAAQAVGFSTTIAERTTMLKMLVADYCGTGTVFTVKGQPLHWRDDEGTITLPDEPMRLEARWTENGAACLNVPRLDENHSPEAQAAFGSSVLDDIIAECGARPPLCHTVTGNFHLTSHNPI